MKAREAGIPFEGQTGPRNQISDVKGVVVGHSTLNNPKKNIFTGVSAVLPEGLRISKVPAATFALNGNGELTGAAWIEESGFLEGPIMLTNTYSVGVVRDSVIQWAQGFKSQVSLKSAKSSRIPQDVILGLPVVGETYDGILSDIKAQAIEKKHVLEALSSATKDFREGSVGAGTGIRAFGLKSGIGSSSRVVKIDSKTFTVGALVQSNFGAPGELRICGWPYPQTPKGSKLRTTQPAAPAGLKGHRDSSIIVVIATDAPLAPHQLKRVAKRASLGLARTGSIAHDSSGDIFIAFSTEKAQKKKSFEEWKSLSNSKLNEIFRATVEATEEAIINALFEATPVASKLASIDCIDHKLVARAYKLFHAESR